MVDFDFSNTKSQLSKLLAMENINVRHGVGLRTAHFDLRRRELVLPIWKDISSNVYDMLIVHEVGHALDTDPDKWEEALYGLSETLAKKKLSVLVKDILNILEDVRIDARQKRRYPGSKRNYIAGYKELLESGFFGESAKSSKINQMSFLDRINVHYKGGSLMNIKFSKEEKVIIEKIDNIVTFNDVINRTEEIYKFLRKNKKIKSAIPYQEIDAGENTESGNETGEVSDIDLEEINLPEDGKVKDKDIEASEKDLNNNDEDSKKDEVNEESSSGNGKGEKKEGEIEENKDNEEEERSETQEEYESSLDSIVQTKGNIPTYLSVPEGNLDSIIIPYKKLMELMNDDISKMSDKKWIGIIQQNLNNWKKKVNNEISYMVKEFETHKAALKYARTSIAKTGVLDTNKVHAYKYSDDLFKKFNIEPNGKNHGFVMFIDWSGSMSKNIEYTLKQLFTLILFCKRIQVPFEVYAFESPVFHNNLDSHWFFQNQVNQLELYGFNLAQLFSSKMSSMEFHSMLVYMYGYIRNKQLFRGFLALSSTPLNQTIAVAPQIINKFKKNYHVEVMNVIFLTDGDSDSTGIKLDTADTPLTNVYSIRDYYIIDTITKKQYKFNHYNYNNVKDNSSVSLTTVLLQLLKDQTECNLIGFFIPEGNSEIYRKTSFDKNSPEMEQYKEDGFLSAKTNGYDEYFFLNTKTFGVSDHLENIDAAKSIAKNTKSLIRHLSKRNINRVLLDKIVDKFVS